MNLIQILILQESLQSHGLFFFTMHQKDLLDCIYYTYSIFYKQVLTGMNLESADGCHITFAFVHLSLIHL